MYLNCFCHIPEIELVANEEVASNTGISEGVFQFTLGQPSHRK